jgi:hypothetical protein
MSASKDKEKFLLEARQRAKYARDAWDYNYEEMDEDIDFLAGDQWDETIKKEREEEGRPCLTFNKLPSIIDQLVGDQRQMRPSVNVFPAQGDISTEKVKNYAGTKDYSLAEVIQGVLRNIEYCSNADIAYDTAFEHCASWGLGFVRLLTDYTDERSFDQEFKIKRVKNFKSVLIDPDFEEGDGSDIEYGFIFSKLSKNEFERKYPGKAYTSVDIDNDQMAIWVDHDSIYIAEYYYLKDHTYTIHQLSDGRVVDAEKFDPIADEIFYEYGITVVDSRKVQSKKCCWAKITGADILEEEKDTVFRWVPVVPFLGKELVVDGTPRYRGAIRYAKDASSMYNYSRTADIERTALTPKVPYILSDRQIEGYENQWDSANSGNVPYLLYKESNAQKPHREPPVSTNPGETQQSLMASDDIKSTTGIYDASLGAQSNEVSGVAIRARQREGDVGSYAFSDNAIRSQRHVCRILIDAIPKLYDTQRLIRLRFPDDAEDFVEINQVILDEQTQQEYKIHDLSVGKFDLVVRSGPSYTTQRMEAAEAITQFVTAIGAANPVVASALTMLVAKNSDWPESDVVVDIIKKTLPPGLIDDPEQEQKPPEPPQPPTPEEQATMVKAQAEMAKAEASMAKSEADKLGAKADIAEVMERIRNLESNIQSQIAEGVYLALNQVLQTQGQPIGGRPQL